MIGTYAISEEEVRGNKMGWCVFDFVKEHLKRIGLSKKSGWYAYKLINGCLLF